MRYYFSFPKLKGSIYLGVMFVLASPWDASSVKLREACEQQRPVGPAGRAWSKVQAHWLVRDGRLCPDNSLFGPGLEHSRGMEFQHPLLMR